MLINKKVISFKRPQRDKTYYALSGRRSNKQEVISAHNVFKRVAISSPVFDHSVKFRIFSHTPVLNHALSRFGRSYQWYLCKSSRYGRSTAKHQITLLNVMAYKDEHFLKFYPFKIFVVHLFFLSLYINIYTTYFINLETESYFFFKT